MEIQSNLDKDIISKIPTSNNLCERRPLRKASVIDNRKLKEMSCDSWIIVCVCSIYIVTFIFNFTGWFIYL